MILRIKDQEIELSEWFKQPLTGGAYYLRYAPKDANDSIGFLYATSNGEPYCAPRFFGSCNNVVRIWYDAGLFLYSDIDKSKEVIDKFIQSIELYETFL